MKKFALLLALPLFLGGCATESQYTKITETKTKEQIEEERLGYQFKDRSGDLRLVMRNNDLYIEKIDGSDTRRITYSPAVMEYFANFSKDGRYVFYTTANSKDEMYAKIIDGYYVGVGKHFFLQSVEEDDRNRNEISFGEYWSFLKEKE
ncbi:MAG: hypothetical protein PVI33_01565 [Candidatus Omnitrophota bacterium]|jgi:hypothetical protein